jgi:CRISPR-associated protein (TIGR02584 family)
LTELLWALARHRGWFASAAFVVVDARGDHFLRHELLRKKGPFEELQRLLGPALLGGQGPQCRVATNDKGQPIRDDDEDLDALAYNTAVWKAACEALAVAGEHPVIFALAAGRRRTMTALVTTAFQMLARPQDECLDVRVSDRRAEGATGFYFPEQMRQSLSTREWMFEARDIEVDLVEVKLPRLRELIPGERLASYGDALLAAQSAIDEARPPRLVIDLPGGKVLVDGKLLPLSQPQLFWYAALARARRQPGDGWLSSDIGPVVALLDEGQAKGWFDWKSEGFFQGIGRKYLLDPSLKKPEWQKAHDQNLRTMRSRMASKVRLFCEKNGSPQTRWLVPELRKTQGEHQQRIALEPGRIELLGLVTLPTLSRCPGVPMFFARGTHP